MTTLLFRPSGATVITPPEPAPVRPTGGIANALFEISYTDPNDPKEWQDESAYLRQVAFTRGSNDELEQPQAGRLNAVIDNRTGRYSPTNTAGPHYPDVLPVRSVRLTAETVSAATPFTMLQSNVGGTDVLGGGPVLNIGLFTGFVEQWPHEWDHSDNDATAAIGAADGFSLLALPTFRWGDIYNTLDPGVGDWPANATVGNLTPDAGDPHPPDESAGDRITRVLDAVGWPDDLRDLDTGVDILGSDGSANIFVDDSALNYIRQIALTDGGKVFIDPNGALKFIDADNLPGTFAETYGDEDDEVRYTDIGTAYGIDKVWNSISVSVSFGADGTGVYSDSDATSIERYYERAKDITLLASDVTGDVRLAAILERFKEPRLRIVSLSFRPQTGQDMRTILRHDLGDAVTVRRRPTEGDTIEQNSRIDQIDVETHSKFDWVITWQLSAV